MQFEVEASNYLVTLDYHAIRIAYRDIRENELARLLYFSIVIYIPCQLINEITYYGNISRVMVTYPDEKKKSSTSNTLEQDTCKI